jgi:hypothetical protein
LFRQHNMSGASESAGGSEGGELGITANAAGGGNNTCVVGTTAGTPSLSYETNTYKDIGADR